MKKRILIMVLVLFTWACDDMIPDDDIKTLVIHSERDLEFAVTGLYHHFAGIRNMDLLNNSDDITFANSYYNLGNVICTKSFSETSYENLYLSMYWPLYRSIASANDIFSKIGTLNQNDPKVKHLLGEVYFIRAYSYFWLVRLFGQVPIIDNVDVNYSVKKSTYLEIYQLIEKEFMTAMQLLPASNQDARIPQVTPHRGTVKALLAEVYLNWAGYPIKDHSMYTKSAAIAKEVIDSAAFFGFGLLPDLADLWNTKQQKHQESVFSLYTLGYYEDQSQTYPSITEMWYPYPFMNCEPAVKFYNSFPNNYRKDITYVRRRININRPACIVDSLNPANTYCPPVEYIEYRVDSIDVCYHMQFRKWRMKFDLTDKELTGNYIFSQSELNVIYLFRYAHTLLTYAEAKARSGNMDYLAYEAVNQIRRRANRVDQHTISAFDISQELSPAQFADSVVLEKAWEFCAEPESHWFDLLRLERIGDLKNMRVKNDGNTIAIPFDMNTYFFPIPKEDQMLNLNLQEN